MDIRDVYMKQLIAGINLKVSKRFEKVPYANYLHI